MSNKFPDTVACWQDTRIADVPSANIFDPAVRVQLHWSDIEEAVERGAIVPSQAHALWAFWASSDSPQRVADASAAAPNERPGRKASNSVFNLSS